MRKYKNQIFSVLKNLFAGQVVSYDFLADLGGLKSARNITWVLSQNKEPDKIPCFKVVRSNGELTKGYKFGEVRGSERKVKSR